MELVFVFLSAILFFVLTPSVIVRLPKNGSKYTVAAAHALIFGFALYFTKFLLNKFVHYEGFKEGNRPPATPYPGHIVNANSNSNPVVYKNNPIVINPTTGPICENAKDELTCRNRLKPGALSGIKCTYKNSILGDCLTPGSSISTKDQSLCDLPCPFGYNLNTTTNNCEKYLDTKLPNSNGSCPTGYDLRKDRLNKKICAKIKRVQRSTQQRTVNSNARCY